MNETKRDELRQRMVAELYGELSPEESAELEASVVEDEALRREWQELREARTFLSRACEQDVEPDFSFTLPAGQPAGAPPRALAHLATHWPLMAAAAAGFVVAVGLSSALLLGGLRVDRAPEGLLVRFDRSLSGEASQVTEAALQAATNPWTAEGRDVLTREEFTVFAQTLLELTSVRLDQLEQRQTSSQAYMTRSLFDALATTQQRQYDDLRTRIELASLRDPGPGFPTPHGAIPPDQR